MRGAVALRAALLSSAVLFSTGTPLRAERPSFLLVVMDTVRRDAVSCYGAPAPTTPTLDQLAGSGIRYSRAYAAAPWTLPSHASMFTGLLPRHHGAGWRQWKPASLPPLIAERLRAEGYETVGISENVWIGRLSGLDRGFEHFVAAAGKGGQSLRLKGPPLLDAVRAWLAARTTHRPFFLFVNLMGAHKPLAVREGFLPAGVSGEQAAAVGQDAGEYNCNVAGRERELAILRGLYLAGVQENDQKLAAIRAALAERGLTAHLITIVTADHGEQFGEHNLVDHQFSVRESLLRVPLIVHGTTAAPTVVEAPVSLVDLPASLLAWAGAAAAPSDGRELPLDDAVGTPRVLLSDYDALEDPQTPYFGAMLRDLRRHCGPHDRVDGSMRAAIRLPYKLLWFSDGPSELYDVERDPGEQHDLAAALPELAAELTGVATAGATTSRADR